MPVQAGSEANGPAAKQEGKGGLRGGSSSEPWWGETRPDVGRPGGPAWASLDTPRCAPATGPLSDCSPSLSLASDIHSEQMVSEND